MCGTQYLFVFSLQAITSAVVDVGKIEKYFLVKYSIQHNNIEYSLDIL